MSLRRTFIFLFAQSRAPSHPRSACPAKCSVEYVSIEVLLDVDALEGRAEGQVPGPLPLPDVAHPERHVVGAEGELHHLLRGIHMVLTLFTYPVHLSPLGQASLLSRA